MTPIPRLVTCESLDDEEDNDGDDMWPEEMARLWKYIHDQWMS